MCDLLSCSDVKEIKQQGRTQVMMDVLLTRSFIKLSVASRAVIHGFPRITVPPCVFVFLILMLPLPFSISFPRPRALLFRLRVELSKPTILCCNPRHGLDIPLTPDLSKICAAQMNTVVYSSAKRENCRYNLALLHLRSTTLENLRQSNTEFMALRRG